MRLMLVNDDGYRAVGINVLAKTLAEAGHQVIVCAPDRERSAASHSFTIGRPLTATAFEDNGIPGYAISGTPADCAKLGLHLLESKVDMVVSGINHGPNLGGACIYSGTVGAAMEASMSGVPAVAVSLCDYRNPVNFETAAKIAVKVLDWAAARPLNRGEVYNLNVPDIPYEEIKGIRSATLSNEFLNAPDYKKTVSDNGEEVYYCNVTEFLPNTDPECDTELINQGWATLTPVTWNFISRDKMEVPEIEL